MSLPRSQFALVVLIALSVSLPFSGCQSAGFAKPDFSKLAFWKRDDGLPLPPPPARNFDPAQGESDSASMVADKKTNEFGEMESSDANAIDAGKSELKRRLEIARSGYDSLGSPAGKKPPGQFGSSESSSSDSSTNLFAADSETNKFDLNIGKIKSSLDDVAGAAEGQLTSAQERFQEAMKSSSVAQSANRFTEQVATQADALKNSFAPGNVRADGKSAFEINQSLYDSGGRLVERGKELKTGLKDNLKIGAEQMRNQFGGGIDQLNAKVNSGVNNLQQSARERIEGMSKTAREVVNQPFPKFDAMSKSLEAGGASDRSTNSDLAALQAEIAFHKQQIEQMKQQVTSNQRQGLVSSQNANLKPMDRSPKTSVAAVQPLAPKGLGANSNSMATRPQENSGALKLKPQMGSTGGDSNRFASGGSFSPGGALSKLQPIPGGSGFSVSPSSSTGGALKPLNGTGVARSNTGSLSPMNSMSTANGEATVYGALAPAKPNNNSFAPAGNSQPPAGSDTNTKATGFPQTPYGGFSGSGNQGVSASTTPDNNRFAGSLSAHSPYVAAPVGFDASTDQSNSIRQAAALLPAGQSGTNQASAIATQMPVQGGVSVASEVDLPASLLSGKGGYAPGSVNALQQR